MTDETIPGTAAHPADVAMQPAPNGNGNGNGNGKVKQQTAILTILGLILTMFSAGLVAIGVISMFRSAADPQAVNATRETLGGLVTYILGVLSGLVAPNAVAAIRSAHAP